MIKRKHLVDDKSMKLYTDNAIKCPTCGHSCHFAKVDKIICNYCSNYVFKDRRAKFEHMLKSKKIEIKRTER